MRYEIRNEDRRVVSLSVSHMSYMSESSASQDNIYTMTLDLRLQGA